MERQCAGCGKVFEDDKEPHGFVSPRPYGCCEDCNKATFRSKEHSDPIVLEQPVEPVAVADAESAEVKEESAT